MAKRALCILGLAGTLANASDIAQRVKNGQVSKRDLEIVLAQYNEDLTWASPYNSVSTVYCKGGACAEGSHRLENVGREGDTFLRHIVDNYDNLAKWTVFSQAEAPTEGYMGKSHGGHMLTGLSFDEYLEPSAEDPHTKFLMTSKVHLPTVAHSLRSSFKVAEGQAFPKAHPSTCPASDSDAWGSYVDVPVIRSFLSEKCGVDEAVLGESLLFFWDTYVQLPRPHGNVVHYVQGARLGVSRERSHQRSKEFYQQLLEQVSHDEDPCFNYLYEWAWYYLLGAPVQEPCTATPEDVSAVWMAAPRSLSSHDGASGMSGSDDTTTTVAGGGEADSAVGACGLGAAGIVALTTALV
jgi:hypothetical protein